MSIKATHQGVLNIGGKLDLPCFVLDDGRRVLSQKGVVTSIGLNESAQLPEFLASKSLKSFNGEHLASLGKSLINFSLPQGGGKAKGYEASVLVEVCNLILEANDFGLLHHQQLHLVKQANILMRAFARVGLVALIDEATGYQAQRGRDELNNLLSQYIAEELRPWVKRFPDAFFEQVCRLRGWQWNPMSKQGPRAMSQVINDYVYNMLPEGVAPQLKEKAHDECGNKIAKLHQGLSEEVGVVHLDKQIQVVTTLMRASGSWARFNTAFNNYFSGNTQIELF